MVAIGRVYLFIYFTSSTPRPSSAPALPPHLLSSPPFLICKAELWIGRERNVNQLRGVCVRALTEGTSADCSACGAAKKRVPLLLVFRAKTASLFLKTLKALI